MTSILLVCLGNICRSPLAHGLLQAHAPTDWHIDSAGIGGWHQGEPPDPRSIKAAAYHGIDISQQTARQIIKDDVTRFDLILGMDRDNLHQINRLKASGSRDVNLAQTGLYLDYALGQTKDVPDPYYGGPQEFEAVYQMCEAATHGLIKRMMTKTSFDK